MFSRVLDEVTVLSALFSQSNNLEVQPALLEVDERTLSCNRNVRRRVLEWSVVVMEEMHHQCHGWHAVVDSLPTDLTHSTVLWFRSERYSTLHVPLVFS